MIVKESVLEDIMKEENKDWRNNSASKPLEQWLDLESPGHCHRWTTLVAMAEAFSDNKVDKKGQMVWKVQIPVRMPSNRIGDADAPVVAQQRRQGQGQQQQQQQQQQQRQQQQHSTPAHSIFAPTTPGAEFEHDGTCCTFVGPHSASPYNAQ